MQQILPDIAAAMDVTADGDFVGDPGDDTYAGDEARPADWWQPDTLPPETPIGRILEQAIRRPWK